MKRLWKAVGTLTMLALLLVLGRHVLPRVMGSIILIAGVTYAISLAFSEDISAHRRWAIAYLALTAFAYFLAGALGLASSWGLVESSMWRKSLISPYPLFTLVRHGIPHSAFEWTQIYVLPHGEHTLFSVLVLVMGLSAIVAALAMVREKRIAYWLWLMLVVTSVLCTAGYAVASVARWGLRELVLPGCLSASYVAAYAMARVGLAFQRNSAQQIVSSEQKGGE